MGSLLDHQVRASAASRPAMDRAAIVERYAPAVRKFCLSQMRNEADADDAAQDTFVRFLGHEGEIREPEGWLINAARWSCLNLHRRNRIRRAEELSERLPAGKESDPEIQVLESLATKALLAALKSADRDLLEKLYVRGLTPAQVAALLQVSPGNVRIMAMRARRRASEVLSAMQAALAAWQVFRGYWFNRLRAFADGLGRRSLGSDRAATTAAMASVVLPILTIMLLGSTPDHSTSGAPPGAAPRSASVAAALATGMRSAPSSGTGARGTSSVTSPPADASGPSAWLAALTSQRTQGPQQDSGFDGLQASPLYMSDHTVFASGHLIVGCATLCPVIYRSDDGAHSWTQLASGNFQGGRLLIPADYRTTSTFYALGPAGLQQTMDGGGSFSTVVPAVTAGALVQTTSGSSAVLLGGPPLLWYQNGSIVPGPATPPGLTSIQDVIGLPSPGWFLASGLVVDPSAPGGHDSVIMLCSSDCSIVERHPGEAAEDFAPEGMSSQGSVVAYSFGRIESSGDGGHSFTTWPWANGQILSAATGASKTESVLLAWRRPEDGSVSVGVWVSANSPIQGVPAPPGSSALSEVLVLPDGRWLMALSAPDTLGGLGVRCSTDSGATWHYMC